MASQPTNPFDDQSNPFQDPSITSALNSNRTEDSFRVELTSANDDLTSFHHVPDNNDPYAANASPPSRTTTPESTNKATAEYKEREMALLKKERELAERERDLEARQMNFGRKGASNFPPCFPFMYHDINSEVPLAHQQTVWWLYREWLLFETTLVLNFIACLALLFFHPPSVTSAATNMGVALTQMFTHTAASFFLWYRPVYNAYMKETSLYYYFYFIFNGFHILYTFYMAIGIPSTGGAGLILLVTLFTDGYIGTAVLTLLATICWIVMGFLAVFLFWKTYNHYKAAGHTFDEAKSEAYTHMGRSTVVREAAANAAWNSATRR
ncbi:scamp family-domain-containing protein [Pilobolus umbonatus]|nr:scamp family-domain-containing protein [Pilobolus umbonatus]